MRTPPALFLALCLVSVASGAVTADSAQLEKLASNAVSSHHYTEARELYTQLAAQQPGRTDYVLWVARLSGWLGDYPAALATYDRVLAVEPRNTDALLGKAYVLMWKHDFQDCDKLLDRAAQLAPSSAEVYLARARYHHYQNQEKEAEREVDRALAIDPHDQEALDLKSRLLPPRPTEVKFGFGQDRFSFTSPSNMGYVSVGYAGEATHVALRYEAWDRFGDFVHRAGISFSRRLSHVWSVRGEAMWGPGAEVLPRHEYSAGFSRTLPKRFVVNADYRFLRFAVADIHVVSPSLEYYFAKPVWLQAAYYRSLTDFRSQNAPGAANDSFLAQYFQQLGRNTTAHVGYAHGNESFAALSIDELGRFRASTYIAGLDRKLSPTYSMGLFYAYQLRSDSSHLNSLGVSLTVRK